MKDRTKVRLFNLVLAVGLLYVGIDRIFDRIEGGDPLARVERILTILAGALLITLSVGFFAAAWKGVSVTATNINSIEGKLLTDAFCAAPSALVAGFFLIRTIHHFDSLFLTATVLFGGCLIADLLYTRHEVRRLSATEIAKKAATQFLWSCIFLSMISFSLGMAVSGWNWFSTDFMRAFNLLFWCAMTSIAIYPVRRDAKRLADAAGPSRIPSR